MIGADRYIINDGKKADKSIKHCTECGNCWETILLQLSGDSNYRRFVIKYSDFPKYGKQKETCPVCLGSTKYTQQIRGLKVNEIIKS